MKPRPGSLWHRLRLFLYHCGVAFDRFVRRPRVHEFVTSAAHLSPLVWLVAVASLFVRRFAFDNYRHPAISIAVAVLGITMVFAQIGHDPHNCRRCLRRMPWGKHRVHAGRAALLWTYHAMFRLEASLFLILAAFVVAERLMLPGWLTWMSDEHVRFSVVELAALFSLAWGGQAGMTHTMYERACKRCRAGRRGGGPGGGGGQPLLVTELRAKAS